MEQSVNLYRDDLIPRDPWTRSLILATVFGILIVWILVTAVVRQVVLINTNTKVGQLTTQLERLRAQNQALVIDPDQVVNLESQIKNAELRLQMINTQRNNMGNGSGLNFHRFFDALEQQSGKGVWLKSISIEKSGEQLQLSGQSAAASEVTEWIKLLIENEALAGYRVEEVQINDDKQKGTRSLLRFTARIGS